MFDGNDPTRPASLPGFLSDLARRISDIERSNPAARASFDDGTRTRGYIGAFVHPDDSNPEHGVHLLDAAGGELLLVDDLIVRLGGAVSVSAAGVVSVSLPTSAGATGTLWNNGGVVTVA
jgi:hypothetical protein